MRTLPADQVTRARSRAWRIPVSQKGSAGFRSKLIADGLFPGRDISEPVLMPCRDHSARFPSDTVTGIGEDTPFIAAPGLNFGVGLILAVKVSRGGRAPAKARHHDGCEGMDGSCRSACPWHD